MLDHLALKMYIGSILETSKKAFSKRRGFWLSALICISLLPWIYIHAQQSTNTDVLWLCEALRRILDGGKMADVAYENNPPLSMLVYILPVLAQKFLHFSLHVSVFLQTILIVTAGVTSTYAIISRWPILKYGDAAVITTAFAFTETLGTHIFFGERDHMLATFLLPFTLMQMSLTYNLPNQRLLKWFVFVLGTVFILLKPHFGLLPAIILLHRIWVRKNLSILKDADFITLSSGTILYIILVIKLFPDYVSIILPDAIQLYAFGGGLETACRIGIFLSNLVLIILTAAYIFPLSPLTKKVALLFSLACWITILSFVTLQKGLTYQILPVLAFLMPFIFFVIYEVVIIKFNKSKTLICMLLGMITFFLSFFPALPDVARHHEYANLPLSKILAEQCPRKKPCSFFMFNRNMGIIHETAYYTGVKHASRFSSLWFAPAIVGEQKNINEGRPSRLTQREIDAYFQRFSKMLAEDFAIDKPDVLFIWTDKITFGGKSFLEYFSGYSDFQREISHYKKIRTINIDQDSYYKGAIKNQTLSFDVYTRVPG